MSRVDRVFVGVLIAIILFCFYMNSKWWFFAAGICTTVALGITIGFWLQGTSRKKNEKEWDTFLDSLDDKTEVSEAEQTEKPANTKTNG